MSIYKFSVFISIFILLVESAKALPPKCLGSKCFKHLTNEEGNKQNWLYYLKAIVKLNYNNKGTTDWTKIIFINYLNNVNLYIFEL
jgi:hypothetical protein